MYVLIYTFDGESRKEEFADKQALLEKQEELKGNRICSGYKAFKLEPFGTDYTRPPEPAPAEQE